MSRSVLRPVRGLALAALVSVAAMIFISLAPRAVPEAVGETAPVAATGRQASPAPDGIAVDASQELALAEPAATADSAPPGAASNPWRKTDDEWRKLLTSQQFYVTRKHGTERAYSGKYWNTKRPGVYTCVCCQLPLFDATTKFDSGTGWPSFYQPIEEQHIGRSDDYSYFFVRRIEVHCSRCEAHLGHVFDDGPQPTGLRYCINSVALDFQPRQAASPAAKAGQPSGNP